MTQITSELTVDTVIDNLYTTDMYGSYASDGFGYKKMLVNVRFTRLSAFARIEVRHYTAKHPAYEVVYDGSSLVTAIEIYNKL